MKKIALILAAAMLLAMAVPAVAEEEKELNIFTWATYFDETTLAMNRPSVLRVRFFVYE